MQKILLAYRIPYPESEDLVQDAVVAGMALLGLDRDQGSVADRHRTMQVLAAVVPSLWSMLVSVRQRS